MNIDISRMGLGTVQFGFDYGVNNSGGKVSYDEVCRILQSASENGINFLDTSRLYGDSEKVLGRAMEETGVKFTVCTKVDLPDGYKELSRTEIRKAVFECFEKSREALRMDTIPMYLLHNYDYYAHDQGYIWNLVKEIRDSGGIGIAGVSIGRGPEEAAECLKDDELGALQIPFNVLDQRWKQQGILQQCREKDVLVINRSTYLQGLLLMEPEKAAEKVPASFERIKELRRLSEKWDIDVKDLVFRYVIGNPYINTTIVGVDSCKQLNENISLAEGGSLSAELTEEIERVFKDNPDELVNPALWNIPYNPKEKK